MLLLQLCNFAIRILIKYPNLVWKRRFGRRYHSFHLRRVASSSVLTHLRKSQSPSQIAEKLRVNIWFKRNALGESDILCDRGRRTHANMSPKRRPRGLRIANRPLRVCEARRRPFLPLSRSKEMERKLIGAVNVNTRMDVRDRKSGLVNWLTVSPLYLLPMGDSALRALLPPPPPPLLFLIALIPETIVSPSRSSPLYLDIFFVFSLSGSLFRLTTDQIERSYAVRSCIWPAVWISDLSACNFRTVESALRHSHARDRRSLCELSESSLRCRSNSRVRNSLPFLHRWWEDINATLTPPFLHGKERNYLRTRNRNYFKTHFRLHRNFRCDLKLSAFARAVIVIVITIIIIIMLLTCAALFRKCVIEIERERALNGNTEDTNNNIFFRLIDIRDFINVHVKKKKFDIWDSRIITK